MDKIIRKCDYCKSITEIKLSKLKKEIEKYNHDSATNEPHYSWKEVAIAFGQSRAKIEVTKSILYYLCPVCNEKNILKEEIIDRREIGKINPTIDDVQFYNEALKKIR